MNRSFHNQQSFASTYYFGTFYQPANLHYSGSGSVNCDKCQRTNLKSCIGYQNYDLCLECITQVEKIIVNSDKFQYLPEDSSTGSESLTSFCQFSAWSEPEPEPLTRMCQSIYKKVENYTKKINKS